MGFSDSSTFLKVTLLLVAVALLLQVLAMALPYWWSISNGDIKSYGGLWEQCGEIKGTKKCYIFLEMENDLEDWFKSVQAFETIGMLALAAAFVLTIMTVFCCSETKPVKFLAFIGSFAACGCIFLGVFIWAGEAAGPAKEYGASFALAIVAAIISIVAGILGLLDCMGKGR